MIKKALLTILTLATLSVVLFIASLFAADYYINRASEGRLYTSVSELPNSEIALVPGTSKFTVRGTRNLYYQYRLEAVVELFEAGKINYILVSGDNREKYYDEPSTMKSDLVEMGIPTDIIYRDFAGIRTLDSVVRARDIFGADAFVVVSQPFHNQRAIYLARKKGIDAIGFNAQDVSQRGGLRTQIRERFARVAAILDVYIYDTQPAHAGEPVPIGRVPGN